MEEKKPAPQKNSQSKMKALLASIAGLLVLVLIIAYLVVDGQVQRLSEDSFVLAVSRTFGTPAATINGDKVLYADYIEDVVTLRNFYASSQDGFPPVDDQQLADMTISRLLAAKLVEQVADELGVEVTKEDVQERRLELVNNFASEEEAEGEVQANYGWGLDTYMEKVVIPIIREEKVQEAFQTAESIEGVSSDLEEIRARHILFRIEEDGEKDVVRQQAQEVLDRIKAGEDFASLAQEFGSDATAEQGGDLGWFGAGVIVAPFEEAIFALEPGQLGEELVETDFGFHIVRVDDARAARDFLGFMDTRFRTSEVEIHIPINNPFEALGAPQDQIIEGLVPEAAEGQN